MLAVPHVLQCVAQHCEALGSETHEENGRVGHLRGLELGVRSWFPKKGTLISWGYSWDMMGYTRLWGYGPYYDLGYNLI